MKLVSILFLRIAIIVMSLGVFALCALGIPTLWRDVQIEFPRHAAAVRTVFAIMEVTAIPFFIGMVQSWRLLNSIQRGTAFSYASVKMVQILSWCAGIISALYIVSLPFFYLWQDEVDAPGLLVIGLMLTGVSMVIAVFAALMARLMSEASELKTENELTV